MNGAKAWNVTQQRWEKDFRVYPDGSVWLNTRTAHGGWAGDHKQNVEGRDTVILIQEKIYEDGH